MQMPGRGRAVEVDLELPTFIDLVMQDVLPLAAPLTGLNQELLSFTP